MRNYLRHNYSLLKLNNVEFILKWLVWDKKEAWDIKLHKSKGHEKKESQFSINYQSAAFFFAYMHFIC